MAFESKKSTEFDLGKRSNITRKAGLNGVVSSRTRKNFAFSSKVVLNHSGSYSIKKSEGFVSETEVPESGLQKPLLDLNDKQVYETSHGVDSSVADELLATFRRSISDLPAALISEIFNRLEPKELGVVSCASAYLCRVASEHNAWKDFYCERWGLPTVPVSLGAGQKSWKELYVEREFRSKTFMGRYSLDTLHGHTEAVRAVFLLPSKKLLFTSGYDSVVRMWDAEEGLLIASSRPLKCTIRAVAADSKALIAGGSDGFVHGWKAEEGNPHLFDLSGPHNQNTEFRLWEHEGPITCLALDFTRIYSGSWDMTIRVWDRSLLKCLQVLRHHDWVYSLVPHDTSVAGTSGSDVYVWETNSGACIAVLNNAHNGNTYSLARSHAGNFLFTGGEDGAIHMFEMDSHVAGDACKIATWVPHTGPVYSLAFEFPWLVSASSDGKLSLIDVRKLLKSIKRSSKRYVPKVHNTGREMLEPPQRMLHGFGCNLYSVDIGVDRIVCGGEEGVVRIWNFSQALEIEKRAHDLRIRKLENRMRRLKLQKESNRTDQCSVAAAKNPMNGDRNGVWHNKRGLTRKVKV